jgi:hypothetical protein
MEEGKVLVLDIANGEVVTATEGEADPAPGHIDVLQ